MERLIPNLMSHPSAQPTTKGLYIVIVDHTMNPSGESSDISNEPADKKKAHPHQGDPHTYYREPDHTVYFPKQLVSNASRFGHRRRSNHARA